MTVRHFLTLADLTPAELKSLLDRAAELKKMQHGGQRHTPFTGKVMAMLFEKSSTRTRVSFAAGMAQLGGSSMFLPPRDLQLDRGEPVEDTARVMSRMVDVIVIRANQHEMVERFAAHSRVPIVNALTDRHHPCQLLADIQTFVEQRGDIRGRSIAWIGDGNNVCHSWMQAATRLGFRLRVATPKAYRPHAAILAESADAVRLLSDPTEAAKDADAVVTDTWASMGQEDEKEARARAFAPYRVDAKLMAMAKPDAIFLHCLPAYRGHEVTADVIDGPQSVVWDEAENRLHSQKALLEFLLPHP
ncbi:MAG TPA: ornithine carbamoyltransferase [Burkholderiales bacterium]